MLRAIVLARGLGTRMREADATPLTPAQQRAADAGHKALMPVNGQPFLAFVLSHLADAGLREVALVVAPDHAALREHFAAVPPQRVRLSFVVQPEPRGTADAVLAAASWTGADPFLVMNADNLYPVPALRDLVALDRPGFAAFEADDLVATSNIPADRVRAFALVEVDENGYLREIVEKPADQSSNRAASAFRRKSAVSMNLWRFDARIYDACRDVPRSARGEYELPEAVGLAIARGMRITAVPASGPVLDLSRRADAADVERRLSGVTPWP
jgi:dTDP-glucose pyrophosphorylase